MRTLLYILLELTVYSVIKKNYIYFEMLTVKLLCLRTAKLFFICAETAQSS